MVFAVLLLLAQVRDSNYNRMMELNRRILMSQIEEHQHYDTKAEERRRANEAARQCQTMAIEASNAFYRVASSDPNILPAKLVTDAVKKADRYRKTCTK